MKNEGKKFEEDFIKSVPNHIFKYRFRDGTGNFAGGKNENVRFQASNICDFMVFNGRTLFLLELKSHKGKSIPLSCFRENQIKGLIDATKHGKIEAGFIVNFRDLEETYYVKARHVLNFITHEERKSIPIDWIKVTGEIIPQQKKKVRYNYDLSMLVI